MLQEQKEKRILKLSFTAGLIFAIAEFFFAIFSHSQSALTDAVYDTSELVFIALILFLTPLFHRPVSEKFPYGFYQVETIFLLIKGVMMLSVTFGISAQVIESILTGGNPVNSTQVSLFQLCLGCVSILVFIIMKRMNRNLSSPTVDAEILGWKMDIAYSFGLSLAFFFSNLLEKTPLSPIAPYFDQIIAVIVMALMLPENVKMLWNTIKELFLFGPDEETLQIIKDISEPFLSAKAFHPVFFDITKTGRHMWVSIYFTADKDLLSVTDLKNVSDHINAAVGEQFPDCTCELLIAPE